MSRRIEEYLETIYGIVKQKGRARTKDIAGAMNVNPSTVTEMIQKLEEKGYVEYEKYGGVALTKQGREIVKNLEEKHTTLRNFFMLLGVDEEIADSDACKIEHVASNETIEILTKFVEFVEKYSKPRWLKKFRKYCNEHG